MKIFNFFYSVEIGGNRKRKTKYKIEIAEIEKVVINY